MAFLTEPEPPRGVAIDVIPGVRRLVARNPGVMTYHGTNTYLIETDLGEAGLGEAGLGEADLGEEAGGLTVLDPGPDDPIHVRDILEAAGDVPIRRIVLSHTHRDHLGATNALQGATGAPTYGFRRPAAANFTPDHPLDEGDTVAGLVALHTPGHASDHLCFAWQAPEIGPVLFSADHVMSWSSSIVNPPDGDMKAYYENLLRLMDRDEVLYLPGHGPRLPEPRNLVDSLLAHRRSREAVILDAISREPASVPDLAERLYRKQDPMLQIAAQRNVLAHLLKLRVEGRAIETEERRWAAA